MREARTVFIRAGLEGLYRTGVHRIARRFVGGTGVIFTFHRVRPASEALFQPNRALEITPTFLDEVLSLLRASDVDIISIDEVHERLLAGNDGRHFVALTFDDGYRDNRTYALPILKRHNVPFTLYVVPDFADGVGRLWWASLESAIVYNDSIEIPIDGERRSFNCTTVGGKQAAYETLYDHIASRRTHSDALTFAMRVFDAAGIDPEEDCRTLVMNWRELRALAQEPLVTIGAHTMSHPILTQLDGEHALAEMVDCVDAIAVKLGRRAEHFAYPVGQPYAAGAREFALAHEAGFKTAVTTRAGVLFPAHADHLTALPRISINGSFQSAHYIDVLMSGAPTALKNRFRRVTA